MDVGDVKGDGAARERGNFVRAPKVRRMLASRACRSAVMIGTALDKGRMSKILHNMQGMRHPWSCPHGRPTMRHLFDLQLLRDRNNKKKHQ